MTSTLQGIAIDPTPPASGEGLIFNGTVYVPTPANPGDITEVTVTAPITGGGSSGSVNIGVDTLVGDSGAGGVRGVAPAPAAGDAAAGAFLKADGTWAVPPAGGGPTLIAQLSNATTINHADTHPPAVDVPGLSLAFNATAGKTQRVVLDCYVEIGDAPQSNATYIWLYVDGVVQQGKRVYISIAGTIDIPLTIEFPLSGLAAGAHTVTVRANPGAVRYVTFNECGCADTATRIYVYEQ